MFSYIADFELCSTMLTKFLLRFNRRNFESFLAIGKVARCENGERRAVRRKNHFSP